EIFQKSDILSLHVPETAETLAMVNSEYIHSFHNNFWLLNTARGKCVVTKDLVAALKSAKIKGAGLDVLEYEKSSFENLFEQGGSPPELEYLLKSDRVILSPHVAGWTVKSKEKLAQTIVDKIKAHFC
ncbi:MAG: NAD(P)-dependent oxidoreductase, partial [Flavobacteriaceae bacterium]